MSKEYNNNMRQQIRLTESELQNIIEESVRRVISENMEDESKAGDWLRDKFAGLGNAFGGDVDRAKAAARQTGANIRNGIQNGYNNAKQGIENGYNNVRQGVQNGIDNVRQGVKKRANAYGAGVNASKNQRYVQNAVNALQQLQQMTTFKGDPTFGPNSATGKAVAQTIRLLNGVIKGRIGSDRSAWAVK